MRILVIGSNGFIGRSVANTLSENHEVFRACRNPKKDEIFIDLLDEQSIRNALLNIHPEIIINCAGIVVNTDEAKNNVVFTKNLLTQAQKTGIEPKRIIISGSAAEYGFVEKRQIPVSEHAPLNAVTTYGLCKVEEEKVALELGKKYHLHVVVARIFNPIGEGMHSKFLISAIISQIEQLKLNKINAVEVSRLDSKRDYIDVKDIAVAFKYLVEGEPEHHVYNIGSGKSTTNGELIDLIVKYSNISTKPNIIESSSEPEGLVANQADISRMKNEFHWNPTRTVEDTIKEIMHVGK